MTDTDLTPCEARAVIRRYMHDSRNLIHSMELQIACLLRDVRGVILSARESSARMVDTTLTALYWEIGQRIHREVLHEKRTDYGANIVATLARKLESEFGKGFEEKNLRRMVQFAGSFPDREIVATLSRQLGWSHFKEILLLKEGQKRKFYAEKCRMEKWTVRTLSRKIDSMLYERAALYKKPDALIRQELKVLRAEDRMTPYLVFRDPCILDFPGLKKDETIERLNMDNNDIRVPSRWADVRPKEPLRRKLHEAVLRGRARLGDGEDHKPLSR